MEEGVNLLIKIITLNSLFLSEVNFEKKKTQ